MRTIKSTVKQAINRDSRTYYMAGVHISKSFDGLAEIAGKLGAKIGLGDTIVVDNARGDKRKAMCQAMINGKKTTAIIYTRLENKEEYVELRKGAGRLTSNLPLIDFL